MTTEYITPRKVQNVVKQGFERTKKYRAATAMFIKAYVGQYYNEQHGITGNTPINLIFSAVRSLVPNIVMQNPVNEVVTDVIPQKFYAELLSLGLNNLQRRLKIKKLLRALIVDAIFGMGIVDTGLADSDNLINWRDIAIDPGQIFSELVSLEDFTFDPICNQREEAGFMGRRVRVPRQLLLDDKDTDHDLIAQLPSSLINMQTQGKLSQLTQKNIQSQAMTELQGFVDVVKLWIPQANAAILIPDPEQIIFDKYIKITDYYGPKAGPYSFLCLTPPVAKNPLPIAPVSIWYDLHNMANRIFKKGMEQAEAQKNIVFYNPAQADEMQEAMEADNMDAIASENPDGFRNVSLGGQSPENEFMIRNLQTWFNYISGNPDQMAGSSSPGKKQGKQTATMSQILQSNAGIVTEDYRGIIYDCAADISGKQAWYLHTDPLIDIPLIKRKPGQEDEQIRLTPEQRCGDFLEFTFTIVSKSMTNLAPEIRAKRVTEFLTNILPALVTSAQMMMQMGIPFNLQKAITRAAEQQEIGMWVQDLFNDPEFETKMKIFMQLNSKNEGKGEVNTPAAISQNGGYPLQKTILNPGQENNKQSQSVAAEA
ncbi:MAG TPA: hypothetical protein ENI08_00610, partial [Candidatus Dependentiae bacterium]|nr:hypothetical protein [Candidatus Dependentiae bacterium]